MNYIFSDYIAIAGLIFSAFVFAGLASYRTKNKYSLESQLLADHSATSNEFGASFAAASSSLATVLIFFIGTSQTYGWLLLWCGFTYAIGQMLFILFFKNRLKIDTSELSTHADFFLENTGSLISARAISLLTFSTFLAILFLELFIGSEILTYLLPEKSKMVSALAFAGLGLLVIYYVRIGGLNVVFRTDRWQLWLMVIACSFLLIFSLIAPSETGGLQNNSIGKPSANGTQIFLFMAWILIINLTVPFTQLSSWQRLAASESVDAAWRGFVKSLLSFSVIWFVPVLALIILNAKGYVPSNLSGLFDILRGSDPSLSVLFYPIIFVGFASALFSTADTALIALQFSISDNATLKPSLITKSEKQLKQFFNISTAIIVIILAGLCSVALLSAEAWFLPLIFAIFGQLAIIFPQILYALLVKLGSVKRRTFTRAANWLNLIFILLAWFVSIGAGILTALGKAPFLGAQEVSTYLAVCISTIGILIAIFLSKK